MDLADVEEVVVAKPDVVFETLPPSTSVQHYPSHSLPLVCLVDIRAFVPKKLIRAGKKHQKLGWKIVL